MRLLAAVALVALVAGCCELPFSPAAVPLDAPANGGLTSGQVRTVTIKVLDPDEPVDGVPVIVFWADSTPAANNATRLVAVALRTQGGQVQARVPFTTLHVTAGGGNWTEEWMVDAVAASANDDELTLRVYPRYVNGTLDATWDPAAASAYEASSQAYIEWVPHDIRPGASDASRDGFARRLAWASINITWTNELLVRADLGLAGITDDGYETRRCTYKDEADDLLEDGLRREAFHSDVDAVPVSCGAYRDQGSGARILAGPATSSAAVMPMGLDYTMSYELGFGYLSGIEKLCERLPGKVVIAYVEPETGIQGADQAPQGADVYDYDVPAPWGLVVALAMLALVALLRCSPNRP